MLPELPRGTLAIGVDPSRELPTGVLERRDPPEPLLAHLAVAVRAQYPGTIAPDNQQIAVAGLAGSRANRADAEGPTFTTQPDHLLRGKWEYRAGEALASRAMC